MLRMVAAKIQACTAWLKWLPCWDFLRRIIFGVLKHRGNTLTTLLGDSEEQLSGENKALFLDFMRKMLHRVPEKRQTAEQLLDHSWLSKSSEVNI